MEWGRVRKPTDVALVETVWGEDCLLVQVLQGGGAEDDEEAEP